MKPVVFFYVQHLLGIGHQMRASLITRALQDTGLDVHYISGGFQEMELGLGGAVHHQLPPIRSGDAGFVNLVGENNAPIDDNYWQKRQIQLKKLVTTYNPDAFLIEGYPFARRKFSREINPLLENAKENSKPVFCSVRDILVAPNKKDKALKAIETVNKFFSRVLVHGDPDFIKLEQSFPEATKITEKIHYTGYVAPNFNKNPSQKRGREIIVSAGGGAVGAGLFKTTLEFAKSPFGACYKWRFLTGPNMPSDTLNTLLDKEDTHIQIEAARIDFRELLSNATLSISQGGYNTVMDIVTTNTPAILIPFANGNESEQPTRASLLDRHGRVTVITEDQLSPNTLKAAMESALTKTNSIPFTLKGAENTASYIKSQILSLTEDRI